VVREQPLAKSKHRTIGNDLKFNPRQR